MTPWVWRVAGTLYIGGVAALAASAFSDRNATFTGSEGAALLLTLPTLVPALPIMYVIGAGIWSITDADSGGPMWPVTVVYTLMFTGIATANLWLLRQLIRRRRLHRSQRADRPESRLHLTGPLTPVNSALTCREGNPGDVRT
ncbi:hypothetical protein GCM10009841_06170 [Microlunatus panaciterrae]|uniref:Membrane protein implicated in regulation of membrane protease activity n=1 Tax=Microlunatus panaciterrae TaxID=400768 RepID=A0ABS2RJ42_9ACTN|nr:hypothetical protein [Microlunatus panaciterrae]MBM7798728.1 membrane protein implicated in regulation of membrane protease activity [Microlunatus panaciterrae]